MSNLPTLLPSIPRVTDPTNQYMDDTGIEADAMHNLIASELEALAVMVGVTGSAVTSTLDHKVRVDLPASIAAAQAAAIAGAPVQSVAGRTGAVTLSTSDVGLGNCDNTSDANKPVSTAQAAAIAAAQAAAVAAVSRSYPAKNAGLLVNACTASTGFTFTGATGVSGAVDSTFPSPEGANSAYVVVPYASGSGYGRINLTQNMTWAATDSISFRILIENPGIHYLQCSILQASTGAELKRTVSSDGLYEAAGFGWYNVTWKLSDFTVTGSPNYGAVFSSFQFQFGLAGAGGGQGRVALSNIRKNASSVSLIVFCQDRGYDDVWTVRNYFAASGIPLTVYVDTTTLDTAGFLTTAQSQSLYSDSSGLFEIASYPGFLPSLAHTSTGICLSQAVAGAGNLTINGSLTSAGTANLGAARKVVISTAGNNRTVSFTITGTLSGNAVSENVMGTWVSGDLVESVKYYDTVTQIAVSAACSGNVTVGTSYSVAEHVAAMNAQISGMTAKGLLGSHLHFAYAGGQVSQPLASALASVGALTGRPNVHTQSVPRNMLLQDRSWNPLLLSATNAQQSLATLQSMVDDIVTRGGLLVIYFHHVLTANDGNNPSYEDLATLISYVKTYQEQGKIKCISMKSIREMFDLSPRVDCVP